MEIENLKIRGTTQLIENRFNQIKNNLLGELQAEKEIMLFEICAAISIPENKVREITSDLKRFRER